MFPRTRKPDSFWEIVGDLKWRLDDGRGGEKPPHEPEFDHGGSGRATWPIWARHVIAFLLGGLVSGALLVAPPLVGGAALCGLLGFLAVALRKRWR